jgi:biotin carboxyl carrier protein
MKMRITVEGTSYDVEVEMLDEENGAPGSGKLASTRRADVPRPASPAASVPTPVAPSAPPAGGGGKQVKSPIAGTVQSVSVKPGDRVEVNDTLLVLEAMKMESAVASPIAGVVKAVHAEAGKAVRMADVLVEFE